MANIGIKPIDKVLEKGITRVQKLIDDLRRDLDTEIAERKAGTGTAVAEGEGDTYVTNITNEGTSDHQLLSNVYADDHHDQVHTVASHDTGATGSQLDVLVGGANATLLGTKLHLHNDQYYTETELDALAITGGDGITSTGNVGTGNQNISVDLGTDPGLEFVSNKLETKVHTASTTKLTKDSNGVGIDESIAPTWTGSFHTFQRAIKATGGVDVSSGTTTETGIAKFPLRIKPEVTGEIVASMLDDFEQGYAMVGSHWEKPEEDYDESFGDWS